MRSFSSRCHSGEASKISLLLLLVELLIAQWSRTTDAFALPSRSSSSSGSIVAFSFSKRLTLSSNTAAFLLFPERGAHQYHGETQRAAAGTSCNAGTPSSSIQSYFYSSSASVAGSDPDNPNKINQDACFHFTVTSRTSVANAKSLSSSSNFCKQQQDDVLFLCGGVLDGHGKKGHLLNEFLVQYLTKRLEENIVHDLYSSDAAADATANTPTDTLSTTTTSNGTTNRRTMEDILIQTFKEAHDAARMNETVPAARSGTTCVTCVVDLMAGIVYTANVGDSRAILIVEECSSHGAGNKNNGDGGGCTGVTDGLDGDEFGRSLNYNYKIIPLSKETTTADANERKRIQEKEGRIDGMGNVWYGPVGIAMTRALGDSVMSRAGVIPTPQVTRFQIGSVSSSSHNGSNTNHNNHDHYNKHNHETIVTKQKIRVLMGTDGIFDVLTNEEATQIFCSVLNNNGASLPSSPPCNLLQEACFHLVQKAREKWQNDLLLDVRIDDATVVVLEFECSCFR